MKHLARLLPIILTLLLAAPPSARAQTNGAIAGMVTDAITGAPLPATNIFLRDSGRGAFADREGRFVIPDLPALTDVLVVSRIGYRTGEHTIELRAGERLEIEIRLEPHTIDMGRVTVTADRRIEAEHRSHKPIGLTEEETIENRSASSTADALREATGVLVQKTTAGHGAPIIRGLIGKDILLLYNGVRLNKPIFREGGNQYLNTIDAEALTRMEVVRGPGSVLYGSDAVGGMVNLISRPPAFTDGRVQWRPRLHTRYTSGDDGRSLHLGLERAGPSFAATVGATVRSVGDLKPGGVIAPHHPTGYDETSGYLIGAWRLSDRQTLRFDVLNTLQRRVPRYDQYASGSYETYLYEPQRRFLGMIAYSHHQPAPWLNNLEINISFQREHEGRLKRKPGDDTLRHEDDLLTTFGTFLQATSLLANRHVVRWGVEYYHDNLASGRTDITGEVREEKRGAYPDGSTFDQFGLFASDDLMLGHRTNLTLGLRYSLIGYSAPLEAPWGSFEDSFTNLTGNLGLSSQVGSGFILLANVSRGFRAPNFNDTVVLKSSQNWVDAPSPGLRAELSTNYEVGFKTEWNSSDIEGFVYYSAFDDLLARTDGTYDGQSWLDLDGDGLEDPEERIKVKANLGEAYIRGAELQGRFRLVDGLFLRGNVFYTYGQSTTLDEPMRRIPPLMGLAGVQWRGEGKSLEFFVRAAGAQDRLSAEDIDDTRIDPGGTPGWSDWNLRGSYDLGPWRLGLTFGNIFDHAYKEHGSGVYNPGRHLVVSIGYAPR